MTESIHPSRRTVVTALGAAAVVALPAWPETARAATVRPRPPRTARCSTPTRPPSPPAPMCVTSAAPTSSSSTARCSPPSTAGAPMSPPASTCPWTGSGASASTPPIRGSARAGSPRTTTTGRGAASTSRRPGTCWTPPDSARRTAPSPRAPRSTTATPGTAPPSTCPATWRARHVRIAFLAAGYSAEVWLDGRHLGKHEGANSPFALPVAGALRPGTRQTIAVRVFRKASYTDYTASTPPAGHGRPRAAVQARRLLALRRPDPVGLDRGGAAGHHRQTARVGPNGRLEARAVVENHGAADFDGRLTLDPGRGAAAGPSWSRPGSRPGRQVSYASRSRCPHAPRWSPASPHTLTARATLTAGRHSGSRVDTLSTDVRRA